MEDFSLKNLSAEIHSNYPAAQRKPIIGVTANHNGTDTLIGDAYLQQVVAAGGVPVLIPPVADADVILNTLEGIDGLLLTGGADYNPLWGGDEPSPLLHHINEARDKAELLTTQLAFNRQIPMLGICRGIQTMAIALEGHVAQDLSEAKNNDFIGTVKTKHSQDADRWEPTHSIKIKKDSVLYNVLGELCSDIDGDDTSARFFVNSFHHQAVDKVGRHFRAVAYSPEGLIEAMESTEHKDMMGVQWHPECMKENGLPLFQWLVRSAAEYRKTANLHSRILTLDTHCDTPMFFHQGVDFTKRDERILVDLHKMTEGRQDATFMVCYLPQPTTKRNGGPESRVGKSFAELVHFDINSPKAYTDFIFDEIGKIVEKKPMHIAFARTAEQLYANKATGKKSIVLGIENGLALEGDVKNLQHFVDRGIVYMTLCHNGDNDICDSAKGNSTHGGVSAFGETVIKEMNRLGVMVDLSHAHEKSFYDALEMSATPIVCSHSNCRALCDHPRNLTDDQLRALAKKGGVAHTTFYPCFLWDGKSAFPSSPGWCNNATILDGIAHLEHAIDIMGIDHVGIGTDFDGDGGVPGMADSSEMMNFTRHLLRKRFSEADIEKIWGGNWLRVMKEVQRRGESL